MNRTKISTTQIAKICGVSQGTVDRALNNRSGINSETKEKILNVAKEYGYRPNIHASSMAGGKSHLIGVVVFDLNNQYFSDIIVNIESYCASLGCATIIMFTNKDHEKEIDCIQKLYYMSVDGIVLCPANNGEEYEKFLFSLNVPIVTFGNKLNGIPHVGIDDMLATKDVVQSVLKKGYKKFIYVKPQLKQRNTFAQSERLNSFVTVCEEAKARYVITDLSGVETELKEHIPSILICPTDIYAIKLMDLAKKHKAGIVGFDNIRLIDEVGLKLDSVSCDVPLTAKTIVDYVVKGVPIQDSVPHKIIKRGSV